MTCYLSVSSNWLESSQPASDAFFELRSRTATVRKPKNATIQFFLEVEGENTTAFTATCNEKFVRIHEPEGNIQLSSTTSSQKHPIMATIVGMRSSPLDFIVYFIGSIWSSKIKSAFLC